MPGINDNSLVHGVIDLIDQRLRGNRSTKEKWEGTPSVLLFREHPLDEWVLTSAKLIYPSGYTALITLNRGMTEEEIERAIANNKKEGYAPAVFDIADPSKEVLDPFNQLPAELQDPLAGSEVVEVGSHGSYEIEPTIPLDVVDEDHYDYEFYSTWRLKNAIIEKTNEVGMTIQKTTFHMVYDLESRLIAALVEEDIYA
ncbi:hypothetical protein ACPA0F_18200 [Solibacillus silvestris]